MSDRVSGLSTPNTHSTQSLDNLSPPSRSKLNETVARPQHNTPTQPLPDHSFVYETYTPKAFSSTANPFTRPVHKMRRYDSEEMDEGRSSVSGSSSGEHDHEVEQGGQLSEPPVPTNYEFAVPKKKRTRTLTTPRQAAVLHALMAQTPFPTTAMREEVGEQIGLTARKVQIWFQNQRQKSKRPVNNNASTASRSSSASGPTRSATVPTATPVRPPSEYYGTPQDLTMSQADGSRLSEHLWASGQRRRGMDGRFLPPEDAPQSLAAGFWLAGPGMPGSKDSSDSGPSSPEVGAHSYVYPQVPKQYSLTMSRRPATSPRRHSQSPPHARHSRHLIPPLGRSGNDRDWRTLPPLNFGPERGPRSPTIHTRSASNLPSITHPDSPFAYHAPYAVQPSSRLDSMESELVAHSHRRSTSSSWSSPRAAASCGGGNCGSIPAVSHERSAMSELLSRNDESPRPGSMSRRFDPVYDSVISNQARGYSSASPSAREDVNMH